MLQVTPVNDPTMTLEWFHDGQPLYQANRFRPQFDFGFVQLHVKGVIPEDSGVYTVVARNALGEDQRQCTLTVTGEDGVVSQTQHEEALGKIEYLENLNKFAREEVAEPEPEVSVCWPAAAAPARLHVEVPGLAGRPAIRATAAVGRRADRGGHLAAPRVQGGAGQRQHAPGLLAAQWQPAAPR